VADHLNVAVFSDVSAACSTKTIPVSQSIDFSSAEWCPRGYFHELQLLTYFSNLYPEGFSPKQPIMQFEPFCSESLVAQHVSRNLSSCAPGEPEPIRLEESAMSVCACRGTPWGILRTYTDKLPEKCAEWHSMTEKAHKEREQLLKQRKESTIKNLIGSGCEFAEIGDEGISVRCSTSGGQQIGTREVDAVKAAMPAGCGNLRPARFTFDSQRQEDYGFVFDCSAPGDKAAAKPISGENRSEMSSPPDTSSHSRPAIPEDVAPGGKPAVPPEVSTPSTPRATPSPA